MQPRSQLTILLLAYSGILSLGWFRDNKDYLAAINSLCSTAAVIVASTLAYFRFFYGRTFTSRVELSIDVDVIDSPGSTCLHSITVSAKNIGTVTISDPQLCVHVVARSNDVNESKSVIKKWDDASDYYPDARGHKTRIDSGESAYFSARNGGAGKEALGDVGVAGSAQDGNGEVS